MCGIVGLLGFGELSEEKEKSRQESMIFLGTELLQMTQPRGKDATGVSVMFEDGGYIGLKMGIPSNEFIARHGKKETEYGGLVKIWRKSKKPAKVFIGHCRNGTKGAPVNNSNNHPIRIGDVIAVHNGTLKNDNIIFKKLECGRDGQVDSEAIVRLLHHYTKNGKEPYTTDMLKEIVRRLEGSFSVIGMSGNNPYQVAVFRDGRPMEMALIKPLNLLMIASEKKFIEMALFRLNKYSNLYNVSGINIPTIKSDDIDDDALPDDSCGVFDLRDKVTDATDVKDLLDLKRLPRMQRDLIWQEPPVGAKKTTTTKTTGGTGNTSHGSTKSGSTGTSKKGTTGGKSTTSAEKKVGRVWSNDLRSYVEKTTDEEVEDSKPVRNVVLDLEQGKSEEVGERALTTSEKKDDTKDDKSEPKDDGKNKGDNTEFPLETVDGDRVDGLISDPTKITEVEVEMRPDPHASNDNSAEDEVTTIEIDVDVDTEAMEKAEEATEALPKYADEEEVIEDIGVRDTHTLTVVPTYAMANRIKKFLYKKGFYDGWVAHKKLNPRTTDNKAIKAAEKSIRTLKSVVGVLIRALHFAGKPMGFRDYMDKAVAQALEEKEDLTKAGLDNVITKGDTRKHVELQQIKHLVAGKEGR